jgi:hypothetical protein
VLLVAPAIIQSPRRRQPAPPPAPPIGDNNLLANTAAAMSVGTWQQISVSNQVTILGLASNPIPPGGGGQSAQFCNLMPWNHFTKSIDMTICDHYGTGNPLQFVRYLAATNQFEQTLGAGATGIGGIGHGYNDSAINPNNGDYYRRAQGTGETLYRKTLAQSSWSSLTTIPALQNFGQCMFWWSGSFTGGSGLGAQGGLVTVSTRVAPGTISVYRPDTASWIMSDVAVASGYGDSYQLCGDYSAVKNIALFGGGSGNNSPAQKVFRLNANGTATAMPNVPAGKSIDCVTGKLWCDPVSGNGLMLSAGELWQLNPDGSGSWTQQTGGRAPPAGVPVPQTNVGVIVCPIAPYGVTAVISMSGSSGPGTFYLYKHA